MRETADKTTRVQLDRLNENLLGSFDTLTLELPTIRNENIFETLK